MKDRDAVKVLLVDDRPSNLTSMAALLRNPGYEIVMANSGEEALDRVLRDDFAVILLDVAMPRMDGFETAALIKKRERSREVPIIFVSASLQDLDHVFKGYEMGAVDYLKKPVDPHALRAKVGVFAQLWRQARRIEQQAQELEESHLRERKALQEKADVMETQLRRLWESDLLGILVYTIDGTLLDANDAFLSLIGYSRDEVQHGEVHFKQLGAAHNADDDARALEEIRTAGAFHTYEKEFVTKDGERKAALFGGASADPSRATMTCFALDITERRRSENERTILVAELRKAVRARDDFLSMAAHELKTPLTALRMQTQSIVRSYGGGHTPSQDRLVRSFSAIDRSAKRLAQLIESLLDVSRITSGRLQLDLAEVDLAATAKAVVERVQEALETAGSVVDVRADHPVAGRWDALRMDQVVENLVLNAAKYGNGKPIEVSVDGGEHSAWLEVVDHGIGMPEDQLDRIFEKFERLAPMENYAGIGLGLWIVKQIVEAHGGTIEVTSREGDGARFLVQLPREPELKRGHYGEAHAEHPEPSQ